MSTKEFSSVGLLSDRYASALYDLGAEENCIEKIIEDLKEILKYHYENKDFILLLKNPLISNIDKKNVLNYIFEKNKAHKIITKFIEILAKNKRFPILINIIKRLVDINSEKRGNIKTTITSAKDLNETQKKKINEQLKNKLGKNLSINYHVDKSIIAGLIIRHGSKMIDSSLNSKINKLKLIMKGT